MPRFLIIFCGLCLLFSFALAFYTQSQVGAETMIAVYWNHGTAPGFSRARKALFVIPIISMVLMFTFSISWMAIRLTFSASTSASTNLKQPLQKHSLGEAQMLQKFLMMAIGGSQFMLLIVQTMGCLKALDPETDEKNFMVAFFLVGIAGMIVTIFLVFKRMKETKRV